MMIDFLFRHHPVVLYFAIVAIAGFTADLLTGHGLPWP